jgi:polysaccharide biosynthesis/export protein
MSLRHPITSHPSSQHLLFLSISKLALLQSMVYTTLVSLVIVHTPPVLAQVPVTEANVTPSQPATPLSEQSTQRDLISADSYALGAGDRIQITIFNVPELSGEYRVSIDGNLELPWLGNVSVKGMTISAVKELLIAQYGQFLTRPPLLTLTLLVPRPIRVAVSGEIQRPGTYLSELGVNDKGGLQWPSLTQAIQSAGGITQLADVRNIQVLRQQQAGTPQVIQIDLWQLIHTGDIAQDISMRDGDTIVIPTASQIDSAQATRLGSANFAPQSINVQVVGEVINPGAVKVPANSTLNQAVLAAGSFNSSRARTSSVELIRLNSNGTVARRTIKIDFAAAPNEATNPILQNNDVIIAKPSRLARSSDALGLLLRPITSFLGILGLFGL